ncbi:MAG: PhoH family protein, partial [Candidatus Omnitrophota bacterium]
MEKIVEFDDYSYLRDIFGVEDKNRKLLEKEFNVILSLSPKGVIVKGNKEAVERACNLIKKIRELGRAGLVFSGEDFRSYLASCNHSNAQAINAGHNNNEEAKPYGIKVPSARRRFVLPKTKGQRDYLSAMGEYDITFSIGPAGTGKTYLAMAMAVNYLLEKKVRRIIL